MGRTRTGSLDAIYPTALTIKTLDDGTGTNTNNDYLIVTGKERWCTKSTKKKKRSVQIETIGSKDQSCIQEI